MVELRDRLVDFFNHIRVQELRLIQMLCWQQELKRLNHLYLLRLANRVDELDL